MSTESPRTPRFETLAIHAGNDEWIWRPLNNPKGAVAVSSFQVDNPRGFGLLQRGHAFQDFQDLKDELESARRAQAMAVGQAKLDAEKKVLELARALAGEPKLLLVDEVASGLSTVEIRKFVELIRDIRDRYGVTVIWVEHIFSALAQAVDRLIVLDSGAVIADAPLQEAMRDEKVLATYLGHAPAEVPR